MLAPARGRRARFLNLLNLLNQVGTMLKVRPSKLFAYHYANSAGIELMPYFSSNFHGLMIDDIKGLLDSSLGPPGIAWYRLIAAYNLPRLV